MKVRSLVAAAVAGTAIVAMSGANAATAPQVVDAKGDANGINSQGLPLVKGAVPPVAGTPVSSPAFDILSVTFETVKVKRKATDVRVTLELAGSPLAPETQSSIYRVTTTGNDCTLYFEWSKKADAPAAPTIKTCGGTGGLGVTTALSDKTFQIKENKMIWTIPLKTLASVGFKTGVTLEALGAHNRMILGAATIPQVDEAMSDKTYKIGS